MHRDRANIGDPQFSLGKSKDFVKPHLADLGDTRFSLGKVTIPVAGAHFLHLDVKFLHATEGAQLAL